MDDPFLQPVRDFLTYVRVECGLATNTIKAYEADLNDLVRFLADRAIPGPGGLDGPTLIEHLRGLRKKGLASSSIVRHLATIRVFGRFLHHFGFCDQDPAELLERPTTWRKLPRSIHTKVIHRLLDAPDRDDRHYLRDRALIELLYATGCRASEVGALTLTDVHRDLDVLRITGKGNRQRLVPAGAPAMEALDDYLRDARPKLVHTDRPNDTVFLSDRGTALSRFMVWATVKKLAARAGLSDIHPHTLRHTFATHLLSGGADLRVVQELLGHARVTTTQIYTHVDQDRLRSVIEQFHPRGKKRRD